MDDPKVTLANVPSEIYVGEDIESILTSCIKKGESGYTGTPYLEYRLSGDTDYSTDFSAFTNRTAATNRNYDVRVVAPASGSYGRTELGTGSGTDTYYVTFKYDYYPYADVSDSDEYFTLEGVDESGNYIIEDSLTVTPAEGFQIACSHGENSHTYSDQLELSEDEITNGAGGVDYNVMFSFEKTDGEHAGAQTDYIDADTLMPGFDDLVFETEAPEIYGLNGETEEYMREGSMEGILLATEVPINDGDVIKEDELTVVVEDRTLNSVTVDGTKYTSSSFYESDSGYKKFTSNTFTSTPGKSQKISVSATDEFNRTTSVTFTLKSPELGNVTASVSVPTTIYAGDSYVPTVTVKGTDEQYVAYLFYDGEEELQPTDAGTHTVFASVYFEEYDESIETEEISYTIIKRKPTLSLTIPEEIYAGEEYEIKVNTDSKGNIEKRFYYDQRGSSIVNDAVFLEEPDWAGNFMVVVHISENDFYEAAEITEYYTVNHKSFTATVTVDDITYGGTVDPVLDGVPEDYDGEAVYEYKLSTDPDTAYSTTVPEAAGTYDIRVTFPETDYYSSSTCSDTFTINSIDFEPEVTVADIYVNGTVTPVLEGVPEDYDGTIKYQYKLSTDSEYSSAVPESAGTYTLLVTFSETAKYSSASCSDTFTISKYDVTATVSVDDLYVGDSITPKITITPNDYNGNITYQYKPSTSEDSAYTTTAPTTAGVYTVMAILEPTDKYSGTSCTDTFTISKIELDPTLTVSDIYVGETVIPVWDGIPDDYDGTITFVYIDGNGNSYSAEPLPAGNYLVRATIPETDKYERAICEADLVVRKNDITEAKVTIENIKVGQTPAPVVTGVPDDYDGEITFAYIDGNGNSFSGGSLPAGSYLVRATIPETEKYERAVCETDLVVSRYDITDAKVSVEDIVIGGTVKPELTGIPEDYDGSVAFEYKLSTAPDTAYSSTVPAEPGTYSVLAIIPETDVYTGTSVSDIFIISKNEVSATVSVADITYGGKVNPVVTTDPADYDGSITYEYKVSTDPDTAYSSTVPFDAGTYTVRATLSTTEQFLGTTCTDSFEIKKKEITATVSVADVVIGEMIKPVVTTISDGTPVFEYKASSAPDSDYSSAAPTAAGTYTVRATIPETKNYLGTTCTDDFKITKKVVTATVTVADITVGHTPSPVVTTESDGKDKATFEYKASSAPDSAFSSAVPTAKGTYTVRATIPETDTYEKIVCSASFEIKLNPVTIMDLSVPDTYAGLAVKATLNTDSDGTVTIMYKASGASDTAYSAAAPKEVGSYVARASVSETAKYEAAECTANFRIVYLEAPATPFVMSGTTGKNGYYTSDVVLNAPAGYTISTTFGTGYSASVPYTEGLTSIYLKRNDGALTGAISIGTAPKIDKVAPSITSSSGSISNGSVVYTSGLTIGANDPHLASLTVNGQSVNPATGMTLTPGMWIKTFTITAEDEAGNVTTISITLKAQWLENKILPADVELPLPTNEVFYFGEGQWIVTKIVKGEKIVDPTVYNGNTPFYVDSAADSYYVTLVT
ncbi:MAG: MBG domain-containing protein [Saccharofermentans sp.]|nr:MBG domain-containing protein [Saccharofermentans sp.]